MQLSLEEWGNEGAIFYQPQLVLDDQLLHIKLTEELGRESRLEKCYY